MTEKKPYKPYGHMPRELRPYLPAMVDTLKPLMPKGVSAYDVIGSIFNLSRTRVQQITLSERRLLTEAERRAILDRVLGNSGG